jgi:signal transduction histidine kinase
VIRSKLFAQHFSIAAASVLGFIALGSFLTTVLIQRISDKPNYQPPLFFAHLVEELSPRDALEGVRRIDALHQGEQRPFDLVLLDEKGAVIYAPVPRPVAEGAPPAPPIPSIAPGDLPRDVHQATLLRGPERNGFFGALGGPGGPRPPSLMKLNYEPARYLLFRSNNRMGPPSASRMFPIAFFTLVVMVLVGVAFALYLIFRSLRYHVNEADRVISELQRGNLKARFPVNRSDEIGKAMERFNHMADEIERLMEQLRSVERSRAFLLQELAHDLRTPVASLSNLLDTIFSQVKMDDTIADLASLAQKETDYIARMVEDLLLLAQVSEPSYRTQQGAVDVDALLEEEGSALELRSGGKVRFQKSGPLSEALVPGDEHLLRRLFRNGLENAFSFARSNVSVTLSKEEKGLVVIRIQDDGDGFSPELLVTFGERRTKRKMDSTRAGRLSLGLGSVIMKTVTTLHRGELRALNDRGAVVEIRLPVGAPLSGNG